MAHKEGKTIVDLERGNGNGAMEDDVGKRKSSAMAKEVLPSAKKHASNGPAADAASAHLIVAVGDLEKWRFINTLSIDLHVWLRDLATPTNGPQLLSNVQMLMGTDLKELPGNVGDMKKLVFDIEKKYVDRTYVQKDFDAAFNALTNCYELSGECLSSVPQATVETQQTTAAYLHGGNLTTAAWRSDVCVTIVAGHGKLDHGKLNLCCETKSKGDVVKVFWPVSKYWCDWMAFITKWEMSGKRLVLVLDVCHAGAAVKELREWCDNNRKFLTDAKCTVQLYTSCSCNELARGGYYLQTWLDVYQCHRHGTPPPVTTTAVDTNSFATLEQNPQYFSSDPNLSCYSEVATGADLFQNWRRLKGANNPDAFNIEQFYRSAEAELEILRTDNYEIVDVKMFVSGKSDQPDGYQIAAIIKANDGHMWSQHVHLCSEKLEGKRMWIVSTSGNSQSSAKKVTSVKAPENKAFDRLDRRTGSRYVTDNAEIAEPVKGGEGESATALYALTDEERSNLFNISVYDYWATTDIIYNDGDKIGTLETCKVKPQKKKDVIMAEVHQKFIGNVIKFLKCHEKRLLYICEPGKESQTMSVAEWMTKCGPTSSNQTTPGVELRDNWNCAVSVLALYRTRFPET